MPRVARLRKVLARIYNKKFKRTKSCIDFLNIYKKGPLESSEANSNGSREIFLFENVLNFKVILHFQEIESIF